MAILQQDKVIYYHPCDSVVDADGVTWDNPVLWGVTGTFPSGLLNNSYIDGDMGASGSYVNNNGANRVTIAFWGYDQLSVSRINIGFVNTSPEQYQILQINATDNNVALFLGGNSSDIIWSGIIITVSGWHFSVFDWEQEIW